MISYDFLINWW